MPRPTHGPAALSLKPVQTRCVRVWRRPPPEREAQPTLPQPPRAAAPRVRIDRGSPPRAPPTRSRRRRDPPLHPLPPHPPPLSLQTGLSLRLLNPRHSWTQTPPRRRRPSPTTGVPSMANKTLLLRRGTVQCRRPTSPAGVWLVWRETDGLRRAACVCGGAARRQGATGCGRRRGRPALARLGRGAGAATGTARDGQRSARVAACAGKAAGHCGTAGLTMAVAAAAAAAVAALRAGVDGGIRGGGTTWRARPAAGAVTRIVRRAGEWV